MATKISKAIVTSALARVSGSMGVVSVLRALAASGVSETIGGRWIAEGRTLIERGDHPDSARCATQGCDGVVGFEAAKIGGKFTTPENARQRAVDGLTCCPDCGGWAWHVPTEAEAQRMRLALADTRVGATLLEATGQASKRILESKEPKDFPSQTQLIKHYQAALDPERFGAKMGLKVEGGLTLTAGASWAAGLRPEDVERLSAGAVAHLRTIEDLHRLLDEETRKVVEADLAGRVHEPALPLLASAALTA